VSHPRALEEVRERRLVAVIRAPSTAAALGAATAIAEAGIPIVEITFTVPGAPVAIAELADRPELIVGAGTVLNAAQAHDAISAGATFIIAPNMNPEVARVALDAGVMYCPGAYTTTEIVAARDVGAHLVKVYPVGVAGGPDYIKVIRDPLPDVPMLAAGGTNLENLVPFLDAGCMAVGLGAALCDPKLAAAGRFDQLAKRAKEFVKKVNGAAKAAAFLVVLGLGALAGLAGPGPFGPRAAHAGTEEFSTFDVESQEEDDESLLDHMLLRAPHVWRDEWERAPQAIRTSQGCLTSGQWFIDTDLKLRAPLGTRALLGLELRQSESDVSNYDYLDFTFMFPTRWGTPSVMFRPLHDKSRQDLALGWELGSDTSRVQIESVFSFEDMFNNFWEFRQSRVGQASEPYLRHPYEPSTRVILRGDHARFEVFGRYLSPSLKSVSSLVVTQPLRLTSLWGALGGASIEMRALGIDWEARGTSQQALSSDVPADRSSGDQRDFRRKWSTEMAARRGFGRRVQTEARWVYQERDQHVGAPIGPEHFAAVDRLLQLEAIVAITPSLAARVGTLYDKISVAQSGPPRFWSFGSRRESRAYLGLLARFGRVSLQAIEGIELDHEPYDVWFIHDKGFLHLQTTF
jgi:2-dehydro-3-deoxyphosphogluconate aldolase/(4S)-4-hydroxy-2-oxoglutarate aldolase